MIHCYYQECHKCNARLIVVKKNKNKYIGCPKCNEWIMFK